MFSVYDRWIPDVNQTNVIIHMRQIEMGNGHMYTSLVTSVNKDKKNGDVSYVSLR